jgi:hypothetical protein
MDRLKAFCKLNGYVLNPKQFQDKKGKIIRKVEHKYYDAKSNTWTDIGSAKITKEMLYIQANMLVTHEQIGEVEGEPVVLDSSSYINNEQTEDDFPL